jgi:hypothetical protein
MELHTYQGTLGWRWTVESEDTDVKTPIGSSAMSFKTEQGALDNAKVLALGILDAFAVRAIEDHVSADDSGDGS